MSDEKMIISFVGAGGKTSSILFFAKKMHAQGRKVLITPTTHMEYSRKCNVSCNAEDIRQEILEKSVAIAGEKISEEKIGPLPEDVLHDAMEAADVVLIEADGSKSRPFKAPASHEPVVLPESGHIVVVEGLSALGQPIEKCCHRVEEVCKILNVDSSNELTMEQMAQVIKEGYVIPLQKKYPNAKVRVLLNQADDYVRIAAAEQMKYYFEEKTCLGISLRKVLWDV